MKILRVFTALLLPLLLTSCASHAPRIDESFKPDQNTTVAYGRFKFVDNVSASDDSAWAYRMALQFLNKNTKQIVSVRFSKNEPISCVQIAAGEYKLTGFLTTDAAGRVLGGKEFGPEDKINVQFTSSPHSAIYLGDYAGFEKHNSFGEMNTFETGLTEVTNNFAETTTIFHEKYPNLAGLPVQSAFEHSGK